ncbi:hypothetical protein HDU98_006457 [Podochytrium sp. JEL0797]|nr:hypothetical protein HDU98_006457 [Podochytrium sp. JEL0797]
MLFQTLAAVVTAAASVSASILTPTRGPLPWNAWNFLSTTDVHGYINGQGGNNQGQYSANMADFAVFVDNMRAQAAAKNVELFVVDCGDQHDGTALSDNTRSPLEPVDGLLTKPAMELVDYDILSIGNHELYINPIIADTVTDYAPYWGPKYLTGNVYTSVDGKMNANSTPIGQKFRKFTGSLGTKVTAFGFLYQGFAGQQGSLSTITTVTSEVNQTWFTNAIADAPDFFLLVGHIALRDAKTGPSVEWLAAIKAIRAVHPTTPIVIFGGHYHIRDFMKYGTNVYGLSAGRYMETIGFVSLAKDGSNVARRYLDANVPTYNYHLGQAETTPLGSSTPKGQKILQIIATAATATNSTQVLGVAPQDYYLSRVGPDDQSSIYRLIGDYMAPTWQLPQRNPAYFIINSGSIRLDIFKGNLTYDNAFQASPFSDYLVLIPNVPYSIISSFKSRFENKSVKRQSPCIGTMGYVTVDDLSSTDLGDDTFHCAFPNVANPYFGTYSPRTLPAGNSTDLWDLVVYDYIEKSVKSTLLKYYNFTTVPTGQSPNYYGSDMLKASDIFPMIAAKYWQPVATTSSSASSTAAATSASGSASATSSATIPASVGASATAATNSANVGASTTAAGNPTIVGASTTAAANPTIVGASATAAATNAVGSVAATTVAGAYYAPPAPAVVVPVATAKNVLYSGAKAVVVAAGVVVAAALLM